jgi:hypothetical protein
LFFFSHNMQYEMYIKKSLKIDLIYCA